MSYFAHSFLFVAMLLSISSCSKSDVYLEKAKSVDSLNAAMNTVSKALNNLDTVFLKKSIARFNWYLDFIEININDTISKSEADNLDHFITSGKNLIIVEQNRRMILSRAKLLNEQLIRLSSDIRNKHLQTDQVLNYYYSEYSEIEKLIQSGLLQQQLFHSSAEEFKISLKGIELLIRSRNNGELPTIVKDSIIL